MRLLLSKTAYDLRVWESVHFRESAQPERQASLLSIWVAILSLLSFGLPVTDG